MKKILAVILTYKDYFDLLPQVLDSVNNLQIPEGYQLDKIVVIDDSNKITKKFQDYINDNNIDLRIAYVKVPDGLSDKKDIFTDFTQEQVHKVVQARNYYRQIAIEGNYDYLLQIDGDIKVPPDALSKLLEEDKDIICGWAYNKKHGGVLVFPNKIASGVVYESVRNGSYCLLEKKEVFTNVPYDMWKDKEMSVDDEKRAYDLRESGYRVYVHPGVFCEHLLNDGTVYQPTTDKITITNKQTYLNNFRNKFSNRHEVTTINNNKKSKLIKWGDTEFNIELLDNVDYCQYELEPQVIGFEKWYEPYAICEDGGFEFDITLNKKPTSNKIRFKVDTENFDWFYQPFLNEEERKQMEVYGLLFRPPEVEDSYAVYHKTKKDGKYQTGKFCHIYRPKIYDKNGVWVWGELRLVDNVLEVIIPQDFLDKASYPIRIDPTFGYSTQGTSYATVSGNIHASLFTGSAGTGTSITAYLAHSGTIDTSKNYKFAVYVHSDLSLLTNGTTNEGTYTSSDSPGWKTLNFSSSPTFTATDYLLAAWATQLSGSGDWYLQIAYDTGSTDQGHSQSINYGTWPNPLVPLHNTDKYSIYSTYEIPSGGDLSINVSDSVSVSDAPSLSFSTIFGAKSEVNSSTANPVVLSHTTVANTKLLVVGIMTSTTTKRTGGAPTFNGVAMTQVGSTIVGAAECTAELWYLSNPSIGTYNVSVPNSGATTVTVIASSYVNASASGAILDNSWSTNTTTANPSLTAVGVANGVCVNVFGSGYTSPATANSQTLLYKTDEGAWSSHAQYALTPTSGNYVFSWTIASDDVAFIVGAFKPATGNLGINVSQSITVSESIALSGIPNPSKSESTTVSENVRVLLGDLTCSVSESTTVSGAVGISLSLSISASDSTTVSESIGAGIYTPAAIQITASQNISVSESYSSKVSDLNIGFYSSPYNESLPYNDSTDGYNGKYVWELPTVSESSSVATFFFISVSVSDTVSTSESIGISISSPQVQRIESTTVAEILSVSIQQATLLQVSVSDSITTSETIGRTLILFLTTSEAISVSENTSVSIQAVQALSIGVSDTTTLSELETVSIQAVPTLTINVSDSASISESKTVSIQAVPTLLIAASESIASSESTFVSVQQASTLAVSVSDTTTISENVLSSIGLSLNTLDSASVSESATIQIVSVAGLQISVSDSTSVSESAGCSLVRSIVVSETVSLSENIARNLSISISANDSTSVSATPIISVQGITALAINVSDSVSLVDSPNIYIQAIGVIAISVSDSVSVSDSPNVSLEALTIPTTDSVSHTETISISIALKLSVSDSLSINETVYVVISNLQIKPADSITVTENVLTNLSELINISDSVSTNEFRILSIPITISISDSTTASEVVALSLSALQISVSDSSSVSESIGVFTTTKLSVYVSDSISVNESTQITLSELNVISSDSVTISESILTTLLIGIAVSESISTSESNNLFTILVVIVYDSLSLSEYVEELIYEKIVYAPVKAYVKSVYPSGKIFIPNILATKILSSTNLYLFSTSPYNEELPYNDSNDGYNGLYKKDTGISEITKPKTFAKKPVVSAIVKTPKVSYN